MIILLGRINAFGIPPAAAAAVLGRMLVMHSVCYVCCVCVCMLCMSIMVIHTAARLTTQRALRREKTEISVVLLLYGYRSCRVKMGSMATYVCGVPACESS